MLEEYGSVGIFKIWNIRAHQSVSIPCGVVIGCFEVFCDIGYDICKFFHHHHIGGILYYQFRAGGVEFNSGMENARKTEILMCREEIVDWIGVMTFPVKAIGASRLISFFYAVDGFLSFQSFHDPSFTCKLGCLDSVMLRQYCIVVMRHGFSIDLNSNLLDIVEEKQTCRDKTFKTFLDMLLLFRAIL